MKNIIQLPIPTLLNDLYIPVIKPTGNAGLIKNKEAKEYSKLVHIYCIKQKVKLLTGKLSFKMDILIKDRKDYDIDAVQKLLFDSLEGIAYKNDRNIIELIVRKHLKSEKDGLIIEISQLSQN